MPLMLSASEEVKASRTILEPHARTLARRNATVDGTPHRGFNRRRSRSADSRRSVLENDNGCLVTGRKRKVSLLGDGSRTPVASTSTRTRTGRQRKHKFAKYATSVTHNATDEWPTSSTSRIQSHRLASFSDEESLSEPDRASVTSASQRRPRPLNRAAPNYKPATRGVPDTEFLKKELAKLQMEAELARKTAVAQVQAMEDLKRELSASKKMSRKQAHQIDKLKTSGKKSEDLFNTIQGNLQCQICLELLLKPFALSPCGHVLCQGCLQEWFRSAPRQPGEDEIEEIPTIYRVKTCPCCRATIYSRPVPLFIIKNLVTSLATNMQNFTDVPTDSDPWQGIFPLEELSEEEHDESDDGLYDSDADSPSSIDARYLGLRIYSDGDDEDVAEDDEGSDSGHSEVNMVLPAWAPAFYRRTVTRHMYPHVSQEHFQLLQRGATPEMIDRWRMRLDCEEGIVAWTEGGDEVYLGWNIALPEDDYSDGQMLMAWVDSNILDYPDSWLCDETHDAAVYRRLVPEGMETEILGPGAETDDEL